MIDETKIDAGGRTYWVATRSYTAVCPDGKSGARVTKTRSASSLISAQDAGRIARAWAERDAKCELQCEFSATASATGLCGYTATAAATDPCSPEAAERKAMAAARAKASYFCIYGHE